MIVTGNKGNVNEYTKYSVLQILPISFALQVILPQNIRKEAIFALFPVLL
jgi:hypothetical protein